MSTKDLTDKAMLVSLSISQWLARIRDPEISKRAIEEADAKRSDIVSTTKSLIPVKGHYQALRSAINAIKVYHESMTLPWKRTQRILPSARYKEYSKEMRRLVSIFESIIPKFVQEFPSLKQEAESDWGTLFKESDYPEFMDLSSKFGISLSIDPIPSEGDWRVNLAEEELERLREEIAMQKEVRLKTAMDELWSRIYKPIKHMTEVLSQEKPRIFKSLISNIQHIVELLPDLNLESDPEKEKLRKEIEDELCDITTDMLRDSKVARNETLKAAEKLRVKIKKAGKIENNDAALAMSGYGSGVPFKQMKMEVPKP